MENGNRYQWNFDHVNNGKLFIISFLKNFIFIKRIFKARNIKAKTGQWEKNKENSW